jgi:hypothetical protein
MTRKTVLMLVVLIVFPLLQACPPRTAIRRSALVPRPTAPSNLGGPIGGRGVRAFGHANSIGLTSQTADPEDIVSILGEVPQEGFAGVLIPRYQLGGGVYGGVNEFVEFGAQFSLASYKWAEPNLTGVLEFPPEHEDEFTFTGGPGLRVNIPIKDTIFTPSIHAELNLASIPQVTYVCEQRCGAIDPNDPGPPVYRFESFEKKTFLYPNLHASVTISPFEDYLHIYPFFGIQRGVRNNGFDPDITNVENDTLTGYFYFTAGAGVEGRYEFATLGATVLFPAGAPEEIDFGPSMSITGGVIFR